MPDHEILIIDDPIREDETEEEIQQRREKTLEWYDGWVASSPRADRRIKTEMKTSINTARDLLLSSLLSVSAIPLSAFPEDERKTVTVTLKEITERIRGLRKRLS